MKNAVETTRARPVPTTILPATLLGQIQALNVDYLDLLLFELDTPGSCKAGLRALPSALVPMLKQLPRAGRESIAACPFTLFSLGFERPALLTALLCTAQRDIREQYATPINQQTLERSFFELALVFASHVLQMDRIAARILFGMTDDIAAALARAPLWLLKHVASDPQHELTPRWPRNPHFWPDLLGFAHSGDTARLDMTRTQGLQIMAAEQAERRP
jgi:hypothetical protein